MKNRKSNIWSLTGRSSQWLGACSIAVCFLTAGHALAQNIWSGATNANWNEAGNWSLGLPAANQALTFTGTITNNVTNNDIVGLTTGAITFGNDGLASTTAFTLGGNAVTTSVAFPAIAITTTAIADGGTPITDTISLPLTLGAGVGIITNTNHDLTISGAIIKSDTTARNLSKGGAGVLTLSGANTYDGITYVDSGTLKLGAAEVIPASIQVKRGNGAGNTNGVLDLNGFSETVNGLTLGEATPDASNLGQTPSVINSGDPAAILTLTANFNYYGGTATNKNGQATISCKLATVTSTRNFFVTPGADTATADLVISGALQSGGGIFLKNGGSMRLDNPANAHTTSQIAGGSTLKLGADSVLGTGAVNLDQDGAGTATLDLNGRTDAVGSTLALSKGTPAIAGSTNRIIDSAGGGLLKLNGTVTYNGGAATFNNGTTTISAKLDLNGGTRTFAINDSDQTTQEVVISGDIQNSTGTAGLTKDNKAGILVLSGTNTYNGATTVSGSVLRIDSASAVPGGIDSTGGTSALTLSGGVIGLGFGDFTRDLGTGTGQVSITSSNSGFAAYGADRIVNLGGASAQVTFGVGSFFPSTGTTALVLSAPTATHTLEFKNPIYLGASAGRQFNVANGAATVDAILSGAITSTTGLAENISKVGHGTLKISSTGNAYGGITYIDSGTLMLGAAGVIPNTSNLIAKRGNSGTSIDPVLDLNGNNETINGLTLGSNGTTEANTNTVGQKPTVISSGGPATLTVGGTINYNAGSATYLNAEATISANLATGTTGNRNINVGDGSAAEDLVISGAISGGAITKQGAGTLVLSGATNYTGNTTVSEGTLTLSNAAAPANANPNNDTSTVTIATTGATLNLTYIGTDKVNSLVIGTTAQPTNTIYGKVGSAPPIVGISQITGDGTITVGTPVTDPYIVWAGAGVNFDADANNDGVENGLAWFLGAPNKDANATGLLPKPSQNTGALVLEFDCLDATARGAAVFQVQYSDDLDAWAGTNVPGAVGTFTAGIVDFVVTDPEPVGGLLKVVATIPVDEAPAGKLFGRLKGEK